METAVADQEKLLKLLVKTAKDTDFGKDHNFSQVESYEIFKNNVPVRDYEQLKPYIDHVVQCFGFDRLMFGGDWPVSIQAIQYPEWVEIVLWSLPGASKSDLKKLFRENAVRFYRLAP